MESGQRAAPARLTVFGGTGRTGRKVVELALARGDSVTVLVRDGSRLGKEVAERVDVVEGDAVDPAAVEKAVQGASAVLSALGHAKGSPKDVETAALRNIVGAMEKEGVRRLVVLANTAVKDDGDRPTVGQRLLLWLLRTFGRDVYQDSLTKGAVVKGSGLDWTLVRASILTNGRPTGRYRVGQMGKGMGVAVSRGDIAEFMLKCATEGTYVRECPYVSR